MMLAQKVRVGEAGQLEQSIEVSERKVNAIGRRFAYFMSEAQVKTACECEE